MHVLNIHVHVLFQAFGIVGSAGELKRGARRAGRSVGAKERPIRGYTRFWYIPEQAFPQSPHRFSRFALRFARAPHYPERLEQASVYLKTFFWIKMGFPVWNVGGKKERMKEKTNLPSPATQCTAMQDPGFSLNFFFSNCSQPSTTSLGGAAPSSKAQSLK